MEEWIFLDPQREADLVYRLAKNLTNGSLYHWEKLPLRLRHHAAAELRKQLTERQRLFDQESAILPVIGPIVEEQEIWLGWEAQEQENFWSYLQKRPLLELNVAGVTELIKTYARVHQQEGIVGQPIWERLSWNGAQLVMADPQCLSYLDSPKLELPIGLASCMPPEILTGASFDQRSDCYYLGLLLYLVFTGVIPYRLKNSWATEALKAGKIIPLVVRRPEISPILSEIVGALLSPDPEARPTADWLADFWKDPPSSNWYLADLVELSTNLRQGEAYHRQLKQEYLKRRLQKPMLIAVSLGVLIGGWFWYQARAERSPMEIAGDFYREAGEFNGYRGEFGKELTIDFEQARTIRQQILAEGIARPLAEVTKVTVLRKTMELALFRIELRWWEWQEGDWQSRQSTERLLLKKKGRTWRVAQRYPAEQMDKS